MLFAAGCAHQRETTARADTSTAPRASVDATMRGQSATVPGMDCEVISPRSTVSQLPQEQKACEESTASVESQQRELEVGDVSNPSFEAPDTEVSATAQNESLGTETQAPPPAVASPAPAAPPVPPVPLPVPEEEQPPAVASPAPAPQPAPEAAPAPDVAQEEDTAIGGAANEGAFEAPDMGGASGGGG
jgi:type IV secretory pathway VirB10-like protein